MPSRRASTVFLVLYDALAVNASYFFALWIRFECRLSSIPGKYLLAFFRFAPIYTIAAISVFGLCRLYKSVWQFASYRELLHVLIATAATFVIQTAGVTLLFQRMPLSYYALGTLLQMVLTACIRFGYRFILLLKNLPGIYQFVTGEASVSVMEDVSAADLLGREAIRVKMDEVFQALNGKVIMVTGGGGSVGSELCRQIAAHEPKRLIIFDVYENNAYDIQLELKDKHPELDLVTLIGSVRDSGRLVQIFDQYRPEIVYHAAAHKHVPLMEDSPCESIKNNTIGTYKTAYVAMAYGCRKFVLISTDKAVNPTNIMGASKRLCEMVIQSFDKKVKNGTTGEIPALSMHDEEQCRHLRGRLASAQTEFVAVRFGNVLDSNGSVVPLFKKQIRRGGPVTVTHPDIVRYFMTIPEAVSLVLQAGTYAHGGEIFVLDMGSPIKIDTLARNLIRLSGYRPDVDIQIVYTGLRPGEKLYEEKLMNEEGMERTPNKLIHVGCPVPFDTDEFLARLRQLMEAAYANAENIRDIAAEIVSTYHPEGKGTAK